MVNIADNIRIPKTVNMCDTMNHPYLPGVVRFQHRVLGVYVQIYKKLAVQCDPAQHWTL